MAKHIEVIYIHGVFRPAALLELEFEEGQHLTLILLENGAELEPFVEDEDLRKWCAESAGKQVPSLEDVRRTLSKIPGAMAEDVSHDWDTVGQTLARARAGRQDIAMAGVGDLDRIRLVFVEAQRLSLPRAL